jgi:hypothetical protein
MTADITREGAYQTAGHLVMAWRYGVLPETIEHEVPGSEDLGACPGWPGLPRLPELGDDDGFGQVAGMLLAGWAAQKRIGPDLVEASAQERRLCGRFGYQAVDAAEQSAASLLSGPMWWPEIRGLEHRFAALAEQEGSV